MSLTYHKHKKLRWIKCPNCKKEKVPNDQHAYWHSIEKKNSVFEGLKYICKCGYWQIYAPTFNITITGGIK